MGNECARREKISRNYLTKKLQPTGGLAVWRGNEYILSFLFAMRLQFQPANNTVQQNKGCISNCRYGFHCCTMNKALKCAMQHPETSGDAIKY